MHILSSYVPYKDMCRDLHPGVDEERCALVYAFALEHDDYDVFWHPVKPWEGGTPFAAEYVYWNFSGSPLIHRHVFLALKIIGWLILLVGAADYYLKDLDEPNNVMLSCFVINIILHLPSMLIIQKRHGVDHTAYLNQAGQVVQGQRDYTLLDTNQGPCYYPAGHLWLYYLPYIFFQQCEQAEHYWKLFNYAMHSFTNFLVCQIGYSYFRDRPKIAQLICYIFLANSSVRREESSLFNDQFLALFSVIGIYFLVFEVNLFQEDGTSSRFIQQRLNGPSSHKPKSSYMQKIDCISIPLFKMNPYSQAINSIIQVSLSSLFFSIALSLKAGGILFMPALLGLI